MTTPPVTARSDAGLQQERTALAWERTAVATMVAALLLTRYAAEDANRLIAVAGLAQTVLGAFVLVWAHLHRDRRRPPGDQRSIARTGMNQLVATATAGFSALALVLVITVSLRS